jgi:hypothetical protein
MEIGGITHAQSLKLTSDSFSCVFDAFYAVDVFKNRKALTGEAFVLSSSIVSVRKGRTSKGTSSLDGERRGTNAEYWYLVNEGLTSTSCVSDYAETIVIKG